MNDHNKPIAIANLAAGIAVMKILFASLAGSEFRRSPIAR
jgi:hypothetical protein